MNFDKLNYHIRQAQLLEGDALNLPKGWEIKSIGDVCNVQRGLTYSGKDTADISSQIVLRSTNIDLETGKLLFDELKYLREDLEIKPTYFLRKNSLLVCFSSGSKSHLGKVALVDADYPNFYFGGFIGQITPMEPIEPIFLYYCLISESYKDYILNLTDGVNINNLKAVDLKAFQIPLPPLPEQQRIVSILDKAFAAIDKAKANAEQNRKNAKELFESYLQGVFENKGEGWEEKTLGDNNLVEIIDGDRGKNYPTQKDFLDDGYCLFMNTKNVRPNGFSFDTTMFINQAKDKAMGKGKLKRNDVVMTTRGTIGNIGVYNDEVEFDNIRINSGMLIFRPNQLRIASNYLFEIFRSGLFKEQTKKHVSGAAQPQLPIKTLVNFTIPVPKSLKTQQTIVHQLDALSAETQKMEAIYQKKIVDLEELKKSVLQKAFAGELRGSEPVEPKTEKVVAV